MATRERTYRCVGGPCDGMIHTMCEERRVRLSPGHDAGAGPVRDEAAADYDVRRLLAPDGKWHAFLVFSTLTTMQATVWLNRRR